MREKIEDMSREDIINEIMNTPYRDLTPHQRTIVQKLEKSRRKKVVWSGREPYVKAKHGKL